MIKWLNPVPLKLVESDQSESFKHMKPGETALPLRPHPGAFAAIRQHHVHEGVDLYCPEGAEVKAVEGGTVVRVMPFTGVAAGCDWWHDTDAVLVEGQSGVVVYGELTPAVKEGDKISAGQLIGHIKQVLKEDKGRPMSMLHLELHAHGTRDVFEWLEPGKKPASLRDPTPYLKEAAQ